jgi:small GTP-binding protein
MPANLPPQYYALEKEFKKETDLHEKLRLAKELLGIMPKHKGTDKLQADLKAKISKLKKQIESGRKKHGARRSDTLDHIEKEGAAQIILIGPPNSGKSSLLDSLTNFKPLIADYPYTTREPIAGIMTFETVQFQLIDTSPISEEQLDTYLLNLIRQADMVVVVVDVSDPGVEDSLKVVYDRLNEKRIILVPQIPEKIDDPRMAFKKTIIAAHKFLERNGEKGFKRLKEKYSNLTIIPTSILDDDSLNNFKAAIFNSLGIIRVYTKRIGHDVDYIDPIILPIGGTVEDAAIVLHKDFAYKLQYAKVWGKGKFEGQRVKNSFILSDKDVIEFHI